MISGSLSIASQAQNSDHRAEFAQRAQNFKALGDALQSGDLAGAQKAFDTMQANAPKNNTNANNPMANDFSALGDALKSGDVSAAQKAFATLQQDGKALHKAHGHHHHGGAQTAAAAAVPSASQDQDAGAVTGFGNATLDVSA